MVPSFSGSPASPNILRVLAHGEDEHVVVRERKLESMDQQIMLAFPLAHLPFSLKWESGVYNWEICRWIGNLELYIQRAQATIRMGEAM